MLWLVACGGVHAQVIELLPPPNAVPPPSDPNAVPPDLGDVAVPEPPGSFSFLQPAEAFWPTWLKPGTWFGPKPWDGAVELGINGSEGNANSFSINFGIDSSYETERTNWDTDFHYAKTEANGMETQHYALLYSDWDVKLAWPSWSWFNKLGLEYDEFKDFNVRFFLNTGLGYLFIDNDKTELRGRAGAGGSREFGGSENNWVPEAVFGCDFAHQLTPRQKLSVVFDYFPAWDDFNDYRMITDAGWEIVLNDAENLSLKVGLIDRFDSTPQTAERNDINYTLVLIWKM